VFNPNKDFTSKNAMNKFHEIDQEESGAIIATVNNLATRLNKSGEDITFDKAVLVETEQGDYEVYICLERKK
jgi:hypothetical protein